MSWTSGYIKPDYIETDYKIIGLDKWGDWERIRKLEDDDVDFNAIFILIHIYMRLG